MKDQNAFDDLPKKPKIVEKGRKNQKLKRLVRELDPTNLPEDDTFYEIDQFSKMKYARR